MSTLFRRHFEGKTPKSFCYSVIAARFVGKSVIVWTFSEIKLIQFISE